MAYKFQVGDALLSGSLIQQGSIDVENPGSNNQVLSFDGTTVVDQHRNITGSSIRGVAISGSGQGSFESLNLGGGRATVSNVGVADFAGSVTAGTSFIIGSADLNETDLEKLDGITNGAGAANKALVLDANSTIASGLVALTASSGVKAGELEASGHVIAPAFISTNLISGSGDLLANRLGIGGANYAAALAQINEDGAGTFASVTSLGNVSGSEFQIAGNVVVANTTRISSAGAATFTSIAGTSISGSGVLSINQIKSSGSIAGTDFEVGGLLKLPDVTSGKILVADGTSFEEVAMSGDIAIAANGATTIQNDAVESGMLNDNVISGQTELAQGSLDAADELLISDGGTLKRFGVDSLAKDSGALVDEAAAVVADDYLLFLDGGATGETKKESIADLVSSFAGGGLTATDGVLAVQGNAVTLATDTVVLSEGYNFFTGSETAVCSLPSGSLGDVVTVKAGATGAGKTITINRSGSQTIDGNTSIVLESPFAAVTLVYVKANDWRIV